MMSAVAWEDGNFELPFSIKYFEGFFKQLGSLGCM